jgi:hypothetical protein
MSIVQYSKIEINIKYIKYNMLIIKSHILNSLLFNVCYFYNL